VCRYDKCHKAECRGKGELTLATTLSLMTFIITTLSLTAPQHSVHGIQHKRIITTPRKNLYLIGPDNISKSLGRNYEHQRQFKLLKKTN